MNAPQRFSPSAGIAIGPILFIIAMLAVLAAAMAGGGGDFQMASISDRVNADISTQANLIRNTINNCNLQYQMGIASGSISTPSTDRYPFGSALSTATLVSALKCSPLNPSAPDSAPGLWNDTVNNLLLPPPTKGFNAWQYINAGDSGGRCIWTTPTGANPINNKGNVAGLSRAASKFNSGTAYDATKEVIYNPAGASQKFVVWITTPTGSVNSNCQ